ncbi:hypothetical protein JHK87_027700 [Glycine soja]|nr:hypothetical protein JHK87_027700 [Glycine soja]
MYVPTRTETLRIAKYLCKFGVKATTYNAGLPKLHLRRVHKEFHENTLEVIVATIAFGMGIDKSNVRRIIHYGWPQSQRSEDKFCDDIFGYRIGEILDGRYEVTTAHGKGVFSTVVRTKNLNMGNGELEEVAIKIIRSNDTM